MALVVANNNLDLETHNITWEVIQRILDIEEVSAKELLNGTIPFEKWEIEKMEKDLSVKLKSFVSVS